MASDEDQQLLTHNRRNVICRWPSGRRISMPSGLKMRIKRRRLPSVRLGKRRNGGFFSVRVFRRFRLRWLRLRYSCMLKRLKESYSSLVKDLLGSGDTLESIQSRIMMETYFSVPVLPMSVTTMPYHETSPLARLRN